MNTISEYVLGKHLNTFPHREALKALGFRIVTGAINPKTGKPSFEGWATDDQDTYVKGHFIVTGTVAPGGGGNLSAADQNSASIGGTGSQGMATNQGGEAKQQGTGSGQTSGGDQNDHAQPNEAPEAKSYDEEQVFELIDSLNSKQVQAVARLAREATGNKFVDTGRNDLEKQKAHLKTMANAEQLAGMIQQVLGETPQAKAPQPKPIAINDEQRVVDDEQRVVEKALQALNEAFTKPKAPKGPDEDRIREIAREEASALDESLKSAIQNIVTEATQSLQAQPVNSPQYVPAIPQTVHLQIAELPVVDTTGMHPRTTLVAALLHAGLHVCLVGKTGVGKTYMAGNVAKLLNVRYAGAISVTGGVSESQLTGWLIPIGEGRYLPAPFIDAFENGGLFLADEIDAADPNVALAMNQALSDQKIFIAARAASGLDPCVHQHKDFVFIAGANTYLRGGGSQFNGRNAQDAALRDRLIFVAIKTDYAYEAALCGIPAPADAEQVWTPVAVLTDAERKLWGPWKWAVEKHLESQTSAKDAAQYTFGTRSLQRALACRSVGVSTALTCELLFSGWNPTTIAGLGDLANGPVGTVA